MFAILDFENDGCLDDGNVVALFQETCFPKTGRTLWVGDVLLDENALAVLKSNALRDAKVNGLGSASSQLPRILRQVCKAKINPVHNAEDPEVTLNLLSQLVGFSNQILIIDRYLRFTKDPNDTTWKPWGQPFFAELVNRFGERTVHNPNAPIEIILHMLFDTRNDPVTGPFWKEPNIDHLKRTRIEATIYQDFRRLEELLRDSCHPRHTFKFKLKVHTRRKDFHSRVCMVMSPYLGFGLSHSLPNHMTDTAPREAFFCPPTLLDPYMEIDRKEVFQEFAFEISGQATQKESDLVQA
jgi:hypothetical protein